MSKNEIPHGCINELHEKYRYVSIQLGSRITLETKSVRMIYTETDPIIRDMVKVDPNTFEQTTVRGKMITHYILRIEDKRPDVIVRAFIEAKLPADNCIILGPLETKE